MHVAVQAIAGVMLLTALAPPIHAQDLVEAAPAVPAIQTAVEVRPPSPPPPPPEPEERTPFLDRWNLAAELSYTDQSGNKTLRLLTGGFKWAHQDRQRFELDGSLQSRYGQSDGEVVARNYYGTLNFSPWKQTRVAPTFSIKAERDPFKRLDLRFLGSAGAKLTPYRRDGGRGELSIFLMSSYEFQNLRITDPDDDSDEFTHVPRWTMEVRGSHRINSSVTAHLQSSYEPAWDYLADYLLRSQTGMKVVLTEELALSLEYQFNRTNRPPEGVSPDDRLFKTGIIIDF